MKSILMSIRPNWCELIANGTKTIEVRKTKPKLEPPFKVYIYCTQEKGYNDVLWCSGVIGRMSDKANGKVIGEFMCYDISEYESEFYPDDEQPVYESIAEWNAECEVWEAVASNDDTYRTNFLKNTCLCLEDFRAYLGVGEIHFYGWHISDLKIYDKPKELSEFGRIKGNVFNPLSRPPQSWCYVEEI